MGCQHSFGCVVPPLFWLQAASSAASVCATSGDAFCFSKAQSDALAKCLSGR